MIRTRVFLILSILLVMMTGCVVDGASTSDLFPGSVGEYLRIAGPAPDPATGIEQATFQGPGGNLRLYAEWVGEGNIDQSLSQLPPLAENVGYDPALGPRDGVFFTFGGEYHAAWGNGDWVFVLSASTEAARSAFLAFYGF